MSLKNESLCSERFKCLECFVKLVENILYGPCSCQKQILNLVWFLLQKLPLDGEVSRNMGKWIEFDVFLQLFLIGALRACYNFPIHSFCFLKMNMNEIYCDIYCDNCQIFLFFVNYHILTETLTGDSGHWVKKRYLCHVCSVHEDKVQFDLTYWEIFSSSNLISRFNTF